MNISFNRNLRTITRRTPNELASKRSLEKVKSVVTDEALEKMRQIAIKDAKNDNHGSPESTAFIMECRAKIAPDRKTAFADAENHAEAEILKKTSGPMTILEVFLKLEGNLDNGYSYTGKCSLKDGWVNLNAYDENGELIGQRFRRGWVDVQTSYEGECHALLAKEYNKAFKECKRILKANQTSGQPSDSDFNVKV